MQFVKIKELNQIENNIIHDRILRAQSGKSSECILLVNGIESAFVSFDDWSDRSIGFIYEIFVLPSFRKQCLGSELLSYAEELAKNLDCTYIQLIVNAFDREISEEYLTSWYARKGYLPKKMSHIS